MKGSNRQESDMKKLGAARDYACLKLPVCLSKRDCLLGSMMGICLFLLGYCFPAYSEETPEDQADKMHTLSVSIQQHSGLHLFVQLRQQDISEMSSGLLVRRMRA